MSSKRVFISADHGLAIVYFLQSDVVKTLLQAGVEVVLLTDGVLQEHIRQRFASPGLIVEDLRLPQARAYFQQEKPSLQYWMNFYRRAGASVRINLEAVESYIRQVEGEAHGRRQQIFPLIESGARLLQNSKLARRALVNIQKQFTPDIYADLFAKYRPDMVIASTPGWRLDRYLLREAAKHGIPAATVIVGWDNSSSYSLPGAPVEWATCWSEIQKQEMVLGSDWQPEKIMIGGIPSYDGYFRKQWLMPREEYFRLHDLDPARKLIGYACSFITFSPNIQNIKALAQLIHSECLTKPAQLLVRLHPNHFLDIPRFRQEREQIYQLARELPHIKVVDPVPLGGELGYYSGEDMPEKSSMMAYSDVFTTVYSTMVVEASVHGRPVVSVCIDSPEGWPNNFTLPLSQIGGWPTHSRFRQSGAGKVALDRKQLQQALNIYLNDPDAEKQARMDFIQQECTFTDGSAGQRTANHLLSWL